MRVMGNKRIKQLEDKYGIYIHLNPFHDPITLEPKARYKIYTADGCPWENGLTYGLTYKGLFAECRKYAKVFAEIRGKVEKHC